MEKLAGEQGRSIEDIFIEYMDLASEFSAKNAQQFKNDFLDFDI